jgi:putative transposase
VPKRRIALQASNFCHVYNRGNNRQPIFFERENYLYFLRLTRDHLILKSVDVIAYCLMPNHYHFLVYLRDETLSDSMKSLSLAYTKAINKKFDRCGVLFQGRFQSILVSDMNYLVQLARYIHLNPVKAGLVQKPEEWEFSSYLEYTGLRQGTLPTMEYIKSQIQEEPAWQQFFSDSNLPDRPDFTRLLLDDYTVKYSVETLEDIKIMAHLANRRPENIAGDFYVDSSCIDCDTCRWMAPSIFHQSGNMSAVYQQPLTHRDDVADHQKFHDRFGCTRILHQDDITNDTKMVEEQLTGSKTIQWLPDLQIIPVPGHSKGHTVLLYRNKFLFTGDHLAYSTELQHLYAWPEVCWYSWPEQFKSLQKLTQYQFSWVFPGHGRRFHAPPAKMQESLSQCLAWAQNSSIGLNRIEPNP